jgi:hypothetical protein
MATQKQAKDWPTHSSPPKKCKKQYKNSSLVLQILVANIQYRANFKRPPKKGRISLHCIGNSVVST